jgi:predicted GH43/DUF377 family glycosyl hydrolase
MKWQKLGHIFAPDRHYDWMLSHAANPIAEHLGGDRFRIYFSSRDKDNRSSIGFLEINLQDPQTILALSDTPVLSPGVAGLFDDSGTVPGWLVSVGAQKYLYYLGWNLSVTVPWRNSVGLAIANASDCRFTKYSRAPILDRSEVDPFSISYPCVLKEGDLWRMWYGSNLNWGSRPEDMAHVIKYAESEDGINWRRGGKVAIALNSNGEYALSKPCIVKQAGLYRMWYSYRGGTNATYRIGYAESENGLDWERMDDRAGIDVSESGWDSESLQYAFVFEHDQQTFMLYNGNGYGKTGFGLAVMEPD